MERVLYSHRLWPKENSTSKPAFEEMTPAALIEKKALEPLRMSAALQQFWNVEITPAMLQAELDRMERESRDRTVLHELFAALNNDPFLIAETLARGNLAEQSLRHHYASDAGLHAGRSFDEWWAEAARDAPAEAMMPAGAPGDAYRLPVPGLLAAGCDAWDGTPGQPMVARESHTAVWTGSEMIVWGGRNSTGNLNIGGRYKPATDTWITTSIGASVPAARNSHTAVWTGSEMIVWGGSLNTGGRYNPASDSWIPTSMGANVPGARAGHSAVWAGNTMIIWGGEGNTNTGGRYDPATDTWLATSIGANVPAARGYHTAVWTGSEMIIWGGYGDAGEMNTGGRYDPATDTWITTTMGANVPVARYLHTAIWTGNLMIVWGGFGNSNYNTGGRYDPATDTWSPTSLGADVPTARREQTAIWTGTLMIIWGGFGNAGQLNTGGRYDPVANTWTATSGLNGPTARYHHAAIWTGTAMIIWGGFIGNASSYSNTGGRYNLATDTWIATSIGANVPSSRYYHTAVWTGSEMIVWGGNGNTGGRYDPATNTWFATSIGANAPSTRQQHTAVWTGIEMIVWGGLGGGSLKTGGRYNPASNTWITTSTGANVPSARYYHTAVWTGNEMIVWGGFDSAGLSTGGRYNPVTDTWVMTSTGANVASARYGHTVVWTGNEMIVWGGNANCCSYLNTGGRYIPSTDSWLATSTGANVPVARHFHTAVWTGDEMIVWGGGITGGRYNPASNIWITISTGATAPTSRSNHSAVWTGREMIIWGGFGGAAGYLNSGGRYNPGTDAWIMTSTGPNVPAARYLQVAVWTGNAMLVWGGDDGSALNTGGIYSLDAPGPVGTSLRAGKSATLDLNWTVGMYATSYNVKRCVAACIPATIVATPAANSYSEALDATSYFYVIEAVNSCGVTP